MKDIFDYIDGNYMYPKMSDSVRAIVKEVLYELNELVTLTGSVPEVIELDSYRYSWLKHYADECERYYARIGVTPASAYGSTVCVITTPWGNIEIREKKEEK